MQMSNCIAAFFHLICPLKETSDEARLKHIEAVLEKFDADKDGVVTVNDIRKVKILFII